MNNLCCPNCGHDDQVKKVTSIISSETRIASAYDQYPITQISNLSRILQYSQPKPSLLSKKSVYSVYAIVFGFLWFFISAPVLIGFYNAGFKNDLLTIVVIVPVAILCTIFWGLVSRKHWKHLEPVVNQKRRDYNRAISIWNNLYYCARDESVFVPGNETYSSLSQIRDYLYR